MSYFIEYAKSNRAKCKGKCKNTMPKGLLRFASVSAGDRAMTYYRCFPQCMTEKVAKSCLEMYGEDANQVPGVAGLSEADRDKTVAAFASLLDGEEPDAWATDAPQPEPKKPRAAASKKKKNDGEEDEAKPKKRAAKKPKLTTSEEEEEEEE